MFSVDNVEVYQKVLVIQSWRHCVLAAALALLEWNYCMSAREIDKYELANEANIERYITRANETDI